jgi:hypothetical protein
MTPFVDLLARGHFPLAALAIAAGIGLMAASRDLGRRLLGAGAAMTAAVAHLAATGAHVPALAGAATAGAALLLAGVALGFVLLVRIREGFGAVSTSAVQDGLDADAAQTEREL